jgi:Mn-containing catalase
MAHPGNGDYVFNSGNLVLDLLHNFFLECGARTHKARVYEMTSNETARTMIGYLLVRGGVHLAAYALALERVTGVQMSKMLPLPKIDNAKFEHTRRWEERGEHTKLYSFSPKDYTNTGGIWSGKADWADGAGLEVVAGHPEGGEAPEGTANMAGFAPEYAFDEIAEIAKRLMKNVSPKEEMSEGSTLADPPHEYIVREAGHGGRYGGISRDAGEPVAVSVERSP